MRLYSYCLRYDDGAAPNPYWGICTLAICKPRIRRTANVGDWVVGLGSSRSPIGDISKCVVYAMKITKKLSMSEYDRFCQQHYPDKIPDWQSSDFKRKVGDCIYDFYDSNQLPNLRGSVHKEGNRETDLKGENVLLSEHFFYFGDQPIWLEEKLYPIIHSNQGHKSSANDPYIDDFVSWLEGSEYQTNTLYGEPQLKNQIENVRDCRGICSAQDREDDQDELRLACAE